MPAQELRGTHSGGVVALAMLLVVASFCASLWYSHRLVQSIDAEALILTQRTIPSIDHLSAVRRALRDASLLVIECVVDPCEAQPVRERVAATRRPRDAALRSLGALPAVPEEREALRTLRERIAAIDESIERTLAAVRAGSLGPAAAVLRNDLQPRLSAEETAIDDLQARNARQAKDAADRILAIRGRALRLTVGLGAGSIAIALVAMMLVLRVLRGRAILLRQNAAMLEERSRELEAFAGRVAHDLRDPLNALSMQVRVLAARGAGDVGAKLEASVDDLYHGVLRQLERMRRVIDGLLELARQGAGAAAEGAGLSETLEDVVADIRPQADAAGVRLQIEPFVPVRLACAPGALQSVLSNLLGNAVKYVVESRRAPPAVTVRVTERNDCVRIEVEDNGPGIPPGSEMRVFEAFRRLEETSQPGVGLGLAMVKEIVESCGGRVGVVSALGSGSTFWVELRRAGRG